MVRLLGMGIDAFSSIIFVVPVVFILQYIVLKQRNFSKMAVVLIFALYLMAVFSVVGIPTVMWSEISFEFNLIPLIDIVNSPRDYIRNTILNIILFMPFGFLVPTIWKEYRSLRTMVLMGLALSLFIEILQIFTFRLTDIDDLITNTAGSVLGYYIGNALDFRLQIKLSENEKNGHRGQEMLIVLVLAFSISFFLKPFVADWLWEKILL